MQQGWLTLPTGMHAILIYPGNFSKAPQVDVLLTMQVLSTVKIRRPRIPAYSNVTASLFPGAAEIPAMLGRQLVEPVQWESILKVLLSTGKTQLHELGPGAQIKAMMKRIDNNAWKGFRNTAA